MEQVLKLQYEQLYVSVANNNTCISLVEVIYFGTSRCSLTHTQRLRASCFMVIHEFQDGERGRYLELQNVTVSQPRIMASIN